MDENELNSIAKIGSAFEASIKSRITSELEESHKYAMKYLVSADPDHKALALMHNSGKNAYKFLNGMLNSYLMLIPKNIKLKEWED